MFNIHKSRQITHINRNYDDLQKGKMLKKATLTEEEDNFIRYGAVLLLASVNDDTANRLLNDHQEEFLELVEVNYTADLPFYIPLPLNHIVSSDPFRSENAGESLVASTEFFIPSRSISQWESFHGAEPGETYQAVTAHVGKSYACNIPWFSKLVPRCR